VKHKFLGYILLAFCVYFVISNPSGAAGTAQHIGAGLASAASSIGDFFSALTGGGR
jgi:hypothetical protein